MHKSTLIAPRVCLSALILLSAPAMAGKTDRDEQAIARAQATVDAANKIGASGEVPGMIARAQAEVNTAREDLHRGHKRAAFDEATHAGMLADTALGAAHRAQTDAERDRTNAATDAAMAAQQSASDANARAAAANARADSAENAASAAAAAAAAARNTPPSPAPTTTVTVHERRTRTVQ